MSLPCAESCLRNQGPITEALQAELDESGGRLLELSSGTGQHAVYAAARLPNWHWQTSELPEMHAAINAWRAEAGLTNVAAPLSIDFERSDYALGEPFGACFTANTVHFVSEACALNILKIAANNLKVGAKFLVYGPFNDNGRFTSEGNVALDEWLKSRDPQSGIRDIQWLQTQAQALGLDYLRTQQLPANNLLVVFEKV